MFESLKGSVKERYQDIIGILGDLKDDYCVIPNFMRKTYNYFKPFSIVNLFFYMVSLSFFILMFTFLILFIVSDNDKQSITGFFILLTAAITLLTLIYNIRRHVSEDYYKEAKEYLQRSYKNLEPKMEGQAPSNDRTAWLTTARFLKTAERLSAKIIMSSHKDAYIEEREYWRKKFQSIIKDFPYHYYAESPETFTIYSQYQRSPIAESSLVVIYKFIAWDDDYEDPLSDIYFTDEEIIKMRKRNNPNLGGFLAAHRAWRKKKD
ncbi:hypothetical protein ACQ69G_003444 [Yersinia enterocolitica]